MEDGDTVLKLWRTAGLPVQNYSLFQRAWDECIELQLQDKETWAGRAVLALQSLDRWEIGVFNGCMIVGAVCVARDTTDPHVGECLSVFAQYVVPEHRNKGVSLRLMRAAVAIARANGYKCLAYTHRLGDWRYETVYRKIT